MSFIGLITICFASLDFSAHAAGLHRLRSMKSGAVGYGLDTVGSSLSGALVGGEANDLDYDYDDDDTSDDDDADESVATPPSSIRLSAEEEKKDTELKKARAQKAEAENELKEFENVNKFNRDLGLATARIENETQSTALASFLGGLKEDVRKYAAPAYSTYLKKEIKEADDKIENLQPPSPSKSEPKDPKKTKEPKEAAPKDAKKPKVGEPKDAKDIEKEATGDVDKVKAATEDAGVEDAKREAGATFALAFFSNVALLAGVFAMAAAANENVKNYTWFIMDQVVAIFLAVMHFQAFDSLLSFSEMGVSNAVFASVLHCLAMFTMILALAWYFRTSKMTTAILCGAGAHFVSFTAIHASASLQNKVFVGYSYTAEMCIIGLLVLAIGLVVVSYLAYTAKTRVKAVQDDDYMDKTVDFENDVGSTAFSVVWTMFVRFLLTGHHPVDDATGFDHTAGQRLSMFIYACVCLVAASFLARIIARKAAEAKTIREQRLYMFLNTVLALNVAWAFLYWGEWQFFEALFPDSAIRGRVMFAITSSLVGGLGLVALSKIRNDQEAGTAGKCKKLALTSLGLVIAFSWEQCFDASVEAMVDGKAHPVFWKVLCCLCMEIIIIPVYALYMKPISMPAAEAIGA